MQLFWQQRRKQSENENFSKRYCETTQERDKKYSEVKIGGHSQDHLRMLSLSPVVENRPKVNSLVLRLGGNNSNASYQYVHQTKQHQNYYETKIGGHALDHVVFLTHGNERKAGFGYKHHLNNRTHPLDYFHRHQTSTVHNCSLCKSSSQKCVVELACQHLFCLRCVQTLAFRNGNNGVSFHCQNCSTWRSVQAIVKNEVQSTSSSFFKWEHRYFAYFFATVLAKNRISQLLRDNMVFSNQKSTKINTVKLSYNANSKKLQLSGCSSMRLQNKKDALEEVIQEHKLSDQEKWDKRLINISPPSKLFRYKFIKCLGVGKFGQVLLVERSGRVCVLKESDQLDEAVNEINLLLKVRKSPHLLYMYDFFIQKIGHRMVVYIELEHCEIGNLKSQIIKHGKFSEDKCKAICSQLVSGLNDLNAQRIIHRDLKPENILLSSSGKIKIADFGVSTYLDNVSATYNAAGTLCYMAPEIRKFFLGEEIKYNSKADIWSLGAIAFSLLTGNHQPNIASRPLDEVINSLRKKGISESFLGIIRQMLIADPKERISHAGLTNFFLKKSISLPIPSKL